MKTIYALLLSLVSLSAAHAQINTYPDTLTIIKNQKYFNNNTQYSTSHMLVVFNERKNAGLLITPIIRNDDIQVHTLEVLTYGLGPAQECVLVFVYEDGTKERFDSYSSLSQTGSAYFVVESQRFLTQKRIKSVRITNGYNCQTFSDKVPDISQDYFIKLFSMLDNRQIVEY